MTPQAYIQQTKEQLAELITDTPPSPELAAELAGLKSKIASATQQQNVLQILAQTMPLYLRCLAGLIDDIDREDAWRQETQSILDAVRTQALQQIEGLEVADAAQALGLCQHVRATMLVVEE